MPIQPQHKTGLYSKPVRTNSQRLSFTMRVNIYKYSGKEERKREKERDRERERDKERQCLD